MARPLALTSNPRVAFQSWVEYGMRCGMPRLLRALGERGLKADACMNASVLDAYPSVADAVLEAGWELQGHGIHQRAVEPELARGPRVVSLSLHHHLSGALHRIGYVGRMLDVLLARRDTIFMTGGQIADWFIEADRANAGAPNQGKFPN